MNALASCLARLAVVAAIAVALVAAGFGHQMPSQADSDARAYVLAGGDLADICGDIDADGLPGHHADCPACHILASADLPEAGMTLLDADLAFVAKVMSPRESRAVRVVLDPARGMRAPPLA